MEVIEEIYQKIIKNTDRDYSKKEFGELIEDKIDELGGLCDKKTAAKLIARDLGINPEEKFLELSEIDEDLERVSFTAKVVGVGNINTFDREDGSLGRVANLTLADDTGKIRVVLWDEDADLVKLGEIEEGDVLKVRRGRVKDGYTGLEVNLSNVSDVSIVDDEDFDVELDSRTPIGDLEEDMGSVHVFGEVLDVDELKEFENDDGGGKVRSVKLGDESGKISASLWEKHAEKQIEKGDRLKIEHGYTRERYGSVELNVGYRGKLSIEEEGVSYVPKITPLDQLEAGGTFDVEGKITGMQDIHHFERDDGSEGKVANIYLADESGDVRVALWGEKADLIDELEVGQKVAIEDAHAKENNGEVELSVGWKSNIRSLNEELDKITGSLDEVSGGEMVEVKGTVVSEDHVDDGKGTVLVREELPKIGCLVKLIGKSFVENNKVFIEPQKIEEVSIDEEEAEEITSRLLKEINNK
ncbi:replication protein A [archaeon SCG-AAA382B04]|nr:replication protein A [archaeon SCG-AAA382B04]